jgi:phage FluMu protein Com
VATKFSLPGAAHLEIICRKCRKVLNVSAPTIPQAAQQAIEAGWVRENDGTPLGGYFVCPRCPAVRAHVSKSTGVTIGYGDHAAVQEQAEAMVEPTDRMLA